MTEDEIQDLAAEPDDEPTEEVDAVPPPRETDNPEGVVE